MTLQRREVLSTEVMGILGDIPPYRGQSPLPDGAHLRWTFELEAGLPSYGHPHFRHTHVTGRFEQRANGLATAIGTRRAPVGSTVDLRERGR